ncbi:DsbE family thiol:disulfide interchange protein [Thauera mechernichensis]|uniref:DsbE family thiol:disulfide interchange protein n=1 Tax=Thauera mechernichensis TaxID=82788 RepID=A0ABW3WIE6_9RHOO|nr:MULTISPECIES: DsbE family thiol:disulfide interchange protein [Thauera]ENO82746.1 periplasmic protein thiol/disulfide oxidoreductase DsbE [Thauera sp. 27]ENO93642.1 periplasmic protein thiol/disulfide oxidoreductase DsbE [Thauera sp. 28]MDG3065183.1 DsbE family thiol:disulfide interchange protein [Thauera mechernichensis]WBL64177.1 DsbE family thiol:disulfide interchange protein [Thauera sp. WB-2]HAY10478.1 DsbE family thiol:disulfide interchange protein [Thauera sp.]
MKAKFLVPLLLFFALAAFLGFGLTLNPREVPSPLIGKPAPEFTLARLDQPEQRFALEEMRGEVWLLNVWASWCVACREEHPVLVRMAQQKLVPIVGLNYKEVRGDGALNVRGMALDTETDLAIQRARRWLTDHGDPYVLSVLDIDGRVGIDFGVYGVPETFLIDREGKIRYKHIGPITPEVLKQVLLPKIEEVRRAG